MSELALFGMGLLLLFVSWRWMYQPSLLDQTRDHIFDLREEVRRHFIEKGYGLDHDVYKALRDLLNGHLRYTQDVSLIRYVSIVAHMQKNEDFAKRYKAKIEKPFSTADHDLAGFVKEVRKRAFAIMLTYMVRKSFGLMVLLYASLLKDWGVVVIRRVRRACAGEMGNGATVFFRAAAVSGALLALGGHFGLGSRVVAQEAMESCALSTI